MNKINRLSEVADRYARKIDAARERITILKAKRKKVNKQIRKIVRRLTRRSPW